MELDDAVSVLTPNEMHVLRKELAGVTLDTLSELAKVSKTQLSQYERGLNGLTRSQVETCKKILLDAARSRSQALSVLLSREEREDEMATAS